MTTDPDLMKTLAAAEAVNEQVAKLVRLPEKELLKCDEAARVCGMAGRTWRKLHSAFLVPEPIQLGSRRVWRIRELRDWIDAGCPPTPR